MITLQRDIRVRAPIEIFISFTLLEAENKAGRTRGEKGARHAVEEKSGTVAIVSDQTRTPKIRIEFNYTTDGKSVV